MLLLRCSFPADSISRSISFCPSTMATRSSSAWVALNSMRFIFFSPALCHGREVRLAALPRLHGGAGPEPGDESHQKSSLEGVTEREREDDFWFSSSGFARPALASGGSVEFVVRRAR